MNFEAFVDDIKRNQWNVFGVEVYENGTLTHCYGDTEEQLHDIYSAAKTVLSLALGIVYDRGLIDLTESILCYLPKERVEKMTKKQRETFEKLTVYRLLTMSVGELPFRPEGESYLDFALSCEITKPSERVFHYSNIGVYLLGVALTEILGRDLGEFLEEELFAPLGICRYEYGRCPEGYFYGASQMKLTVHELSKIGLLLCNLGVYEGKRIVSEEYVRMATSVQQMNREGGYGYLIWRYRDGFSINGKWGQKCYCLPKRGIMVTYLAHLEESKALKESMERHLLGIPKTLYVTDLDGTLMRDDKSISEYTKYVINTLLARGEGITYATARSVVSAGRITRELSFTLPVITKNGSVLALQSTCKETEIAAFTPKEAEKLRELLAGNGLCGIVTEQRDGKEIKKYYTRRTNSGLTSYLTEHKEDPRMLPVEEEEQLWEGTLTYIVFIGEREELLPVYEQMKNSTICNMVFQKDQYLDSYWVELFPKEASKANAILKIKERYGFDEVVCFGDSNNDLTMFSIADRAYAVGNAIRELKQKATAVIGTNEEDGVAVWLSGLL